MRSNRERSLTRAFQGMKLHVALVSHGYPDRGAAGGIGTVTRILAHALAGAGCRVTALSEAEDVGEGRFADGAVQVIRYRPARFFYRAAYRAVAALPIRKPRKDRLLQLIYTFQRAAAVDAILRRLVREEGIEIVEFPEWDFPAFFFTRRAPVPAVVKIHSPHFLIEEGIAMPRPRRNYLKFLCEREALRRADAVIGVAAAVAETVRKRYGIPRGRMTVIPYPFRMDGAPQTLPSRKPTGLVTQLGRIEPIKGADVTAAALAEIFRRVEGSKFRFIGEEAYHQYSAGSFAAGVRGRIEAAGASGRVEFTGVVPHSEVPRLLLEADVLVQPSRFENYSVALLEALYCGTAAAASDVGGNAEVLDDGRAGILVPPNDPHALAGAVVRLLTDDSAREKIRRRGFELVRTRNDAELIARTTVKLYKTLIMKRKRGA